MAEHRLERVVQYADQVVLLPGPGRGARWLGTPAEVMAVSPVHPPVVALGRLAGWSPLPLSVRDAPRAGRVPLRDRLAGRRRPAPAPAPVAAAQRLPRPRQAPLCRRTETARHQPRPPPRAAEVRAPRRAPRPRRGPARRRPHRRPRRDRRPDGPQRRRQVAPCSRPGRHWSSPTAGTVRVGGARPAPHPPRASWSAGSASSRRSRATCCTRTRSPPSARPPTPTPEPPPGTCRALVAELLPGVADDTHPRDLSEGQRLALALAVVLTARPPLLLLDEPTRGLDYAAKARLRRDPARRWPPRATPSSWPPTTWSWPPSWPTGW